MSIDTQTFRSGSDDHPSIFRLEQLDYTIAGFSRLESEASLDSNLIPKGLAVLRGELLSGTNSLKFGSPVWTRFELAREPIISGCAPHLGAKRGDGPTLRY